MPFPEILETKGFQKESNLKMSSISNGAILFSL
jgi:hypothetical protein